MGMITIRAKELISDPGLSAGFRNLVYYVHQNFVLLVELALSRMPSSSGEENVFSQS